MTRDPSTVRVWDLAQRLFHWGLVLSVAGSWFLGEAYLQWHTWLGYAALAIVLARVLWGFVGSRHALFSSFVRAPRAVLTYARDLLRHREPRFIGHNPLGGWMIVALLACVCFTCVTGILYTTDRFWGMEWLEMSHRISAWVIVALVCGHVGGVVFTSLRHRENLVGAMFSGRKAARKGDADSAD